VRLEGAKCLITGCSSGLGRATAIALAKAGSRVWATARRLQTIEDLAAHGLAVAELDVRDPNGIREVVGSIAGVDVLINNAGYGLYGAVEEVADEELFEQFDTNFFGPWRLCREVLPAMRDQKRGIIANISSFAGVVPFAGGAPYRTSKFALEGLSGCLHFEVARFGIRVICFEPGNIATDFAPRSMRFAQAISSNSPYNEMRAAVERAFPKMCPTAMPAGEVAQAIVAELANESGPLRVPIGLDAEHILRVAQHGDAAYEDYVVTQLGFDWHPTPDGPTRRRSKG
jgi:NAD(P)-dependent dehydrogenase (short-subunit alcohol dehydrogenase family)